MASTCGPRATAILPALAPSPLITRVGNEKSSVTVCVLLQVWRSIQYSPGFDLMPGRFDHSGTRTRSANVIGFGTVTEIVTRPLIGYAVSCLTTTISSLILSLAVLGVKKLTIMPSLLVMYAKVGTIPQPR